MARYWSSRRNPDGLFGLVIQPSVSEQAVELWMVYKGFLQAQATFAFADSGSPTLVRDSEDNLAIYVLMLMGGLAGLGACLLVLQYDVHPAIGLSFARGPVG